MENNVMEKFHRIAQDPYGYTRSWKEKSGGKVFGFFCTYTPEEILHAAGILPLRLLGGKEVLSLADAHLQAFACSLARTSLELALRGDLSYLDGVVFAQTCDTMQTVVDLWKKLFPQWYIDAVVSPAHLSSPSSQGYFVRELERFVKGLEGFLGYSIGEEALRKSIKVYNTNRSLLQRLYDVRRESPSMIKAQDVAAVVKASMSMPREEHSELLSSLLETIEREPREGSDERVRLVLMGNACDLPEAQAMMEELGAAVVDDDMCVGSRYFQGQIREDLKPLEAIAERYLKRIHCPAKHNLNVDRGQYLVEMARRAQADGVVVCLLKFCDPHSMDYPDVATALKEASIPHLLLETELYSAPMGQMRTRLQAFIEMLGGK